MTASCRIRTILALFYASQILNLGCCNVLEDRRGSDDNTIPSRLLGPCEVGCKGFDDCQMGLSCYQKTSDEDTGCPKESVSLGEAYCSMPRPQNTTYNRILDTPRLKYVGQLNSVPNKFPLGLCEGDCDDDKSCQFGLSCFRKGPNQPKVPGCVGTDRSKRDFCYPPPPGHLVLDGDGGEPISAFPLGMCSGDCDGDRHCQLGLVCYQRNEHEKVPHCRGRGSEGADYCTRPEPGQLVVQGFNGKPKFVYPLGKCEGSCENDEDCASGLVCFKRSKKEEVPGCLGDGIKDGNYCHVPPRATLVSVTEGKDPLGQCQGDCTSDRHCALKLSCSERVGKEKLKGCSGAGVEGRDYCYKPPSGHFVIMSPPGELKRKLEKCQGECVSNRDCSKGLSCLPKKGRDEDPFCKGRGVAGRNYCYPPEALSTEKQKKEENGSGRIDKSSCASDADCDVGLSCFKPKGKDKYCYKPPAGVLASNTVGRRPASAFPLAACRGQCRTDKDCELGLSCFHRTGTQPIPGCRGAGISGAAYCYKPPPGTLVLKAVNKKPRSAFPLAACEGDCLSDEDCQRGLQCMKRTGNQKVLGCDGKGAVKKRYCYRPFAPPQGNTNSVRHCSPSSPCDVCQGDCKNDNKNCKRGSVCVKRRKNTPVPGCGSGGSVDQVGVSYCSRVTYVPGDATHVENGLLLSTGLKSRVLAEWKKPVKLADGSFSERGFHEDPDGAAVYEDTKTGGWIYVSNSEATKGGGVGALVFNKDGEVVDYKWLLSDTKRNCGGGRTWYNTWITCEEVEDGHIWEVDPWGKNKPRKTLIGLEKGDMYEAAAYDNRNERQPRIYVTTDSFDGPVLRYSPDNRAVREALDKKDYRDLLHKNETGTAITEYLLLKPASKNPEEGTFSWTDRIGVARKNARANYNHCEGIDMRDGVLYFTCKKERHLFILDIDKQTYKRSSTSSGAFDNGPDQVARILGNGDPHDILYFCEEGGKICGIHGRDKQGNYYTVLESAGKLEDETSGLAFSPDNMRMYLSFQAPGLIFEITRKDGHPFGGQRLDIKYHTDKAFEL